MIESTLSDQWETTIPAAVREALGLQPHQTITYEIVEGGVVVRPSRNDSVTMAELAGSVRSSKPCDSKAEERAAARGARLSRYL